MTWLRRALLTSLQMASAEMGGSEHRSGVRVSRRTVMGSAPREDRESARKWRVCLLSVEW
jgi:hypothetical protein